MYVFACPPRSLQRWSEWVVPVVASLLFRSRDFCIEPLVFMAFFFLFLLFDLEITNVVQKHLSGSELFQCDGQGSKNTHAHTHVRAINFMSPC